MSYVICSIQLRVNQQLLVAVYNGALVNAQRWKEPLHCHLCGIKVETIGDIKSPKFGSKMSKNSRMKGTFIDCDVANTFKPNYAGRAFIVLPPFLSARKWSEAKSSSSNFVFLETLDF